MIRLLFASGLLSLLTACANPDYISSNDESAGGGVSQGQESSGTPEDCTLKFPRKNICLQATWASTPDSSVYNEFLLEFDQPVAPNEFSILLWMPSMGHGSVPVKVEPQSPTRYRVHNVFFIMPGDWEVRIYLKEQNSTVDQLFIPLMVP